MDILEREMMYIRITAYLFLAILLAAIAVTVWNEIPDARGAQYETVG